MDVPPRVRTGRCITLGFCIAVVGPSALIITLAVLTLGVEGLLPRLLRLALTVLLVYGIYVGSTAAKWIGVVLMYIGGALTLVAGVFLVISMKLGGLVLVPTAAVYLAFATSMVVPGPVREYLAYRADMRRDGQGPIAPPNPL